MKLFAVLLVAVLFAGHARAAIAIQDVTVIDVVTATALPHRTVIIDGDRIKALFGPVPAGARVVSGRGKFLIPGLWDMHVHLWYQQNQLPVFLAFGVTGVQDMGSDFERTSACAMRLRAGRRSGREF